MADSGAARRGAHLVHRSATLSLALAALCGCASREPPPAALELSGPTMGTSYRVTLPGAPRDDGAIGAAVRQALDRVDALMSTYRADSEVSRLNRHESSEPLSISAETHAVLAAAQEISSATGGAFDITVGPLVDAWGFGPEETSAPPSAETVRGLMERTGWQKLVLDAQGPAVRKTVPQLRIDLSAIAKGYAVDLVAEALERLGYRQYLVEVGGEIRAAGRRADGDLWRVGVERPDSTGRSVHRILPLSDTAVATSGNYRNFREADGQRFGHVLDPRTGRPTANRVVSATVLDPSAMRADALATALLVLGENDGMALAEREDLAVLLLVEGDGESLSEFKSAKFRAKMEDESP